MKKVLFKGFAVFMMAAILLTLLSVCFVSCTEAEKEVKDPIFVCGESQMPLYFYEYMLSLKKGELANAKVDVKSEEFWSEITESGETYEAYFNREVLDSCRKYFAVSVLFDEKGLKLPSATLTEIDESIDLLLNLGYGPAGDENEFNRIVSEYGVTIEELRECFIIIAKRDALIASLYGADGSLIADSLKNQYYKENYYRFKQIIFKKYYLEYMTDSKYGLEIYFDPETKKPIYDNKNGNVDFGDDDNYIKDDYGVVIYFGADGLPLYDKKNGVRFPKENSKGEEIRHYYTEEEIAEQFAKAEEVVASVEKKNYTYFESLIESYMVTEDFESSYPAGYYISDIEVEGTEDEKFIRELLGVLKTMDEGEVRLFVDEDAYHVIMKYELDDGRFADGDYAAMFEDFTGTLIGEMFDTEIDKALGKIKENTDNISKAKSIKDLGVNMYYVP